MQLGGAPASPTTPAGQNVSLDGASIGTPAFATAAASLDGGAAPPRTPGAPPTLLPSPPPPPPRSAASGSELGSVSGSAASGAPPAHLYRLFVSNVPPAFNEARLRNLFEQVSARWGRAGGAGSPQGATAWGRPARPPLQPTEPHRAHVPGSAQRASAISHTPLPCRADTAAVGGCARPHHFKGQGAPLTAGRRCLTPRLRPGARACRCMASAHGTHIRPSLACWPHALRGPAWPACRPHAQRPTTAPPSPSPAAAGHGRPARQRVCVVRCARGGSRGRAAHGRARHAGGRRHTARRASRDDMRARNMHACDAAHAGMAGARAHAMRARAARARAGSRICCPVRRAPAPPRCSSCQPPPPPSPTPLHPPAPRPQVRFARSHVFVQASAGPEDNRQLFFSKAPIAATEEDVRAVFAQ